LDREWFRPFVVVGGELVGCFRVDQAKEGTWDGL
jgi:hypothetical protein